MQGTYIYCLKDPVDFSIKYIGKSNNPKDRYVNHISEARTNKGINSEKDKWIQNLLGKNLAPTLEVVEEVTFDNWEEKERYWIKKYKGENQPLLNKALGGYGSFACLKGKTSKYIKVTFAKDKTKYPWLVQFHLPNKDKVVHVGHFATEIEAAKIADSLYLYYYGETPNKELYPDDFNEQCSGIYPISFKDIKEQLKQRELDDRPEYLIYYDKFAKRWIAHKTVIGRSNGIRRHNITIEEAITLAESWFNRVPNQQEIEVIKQQILNNQNKQSSKYKGVSFKKDGRYYVETRVKGKRYYGGAFLNEIDAALAYNKLVLENNLNKELNVINTAN